MWYNIICSIMKIRVYDKSKREIAKSYLKYESAASIDECVLIQQSLKGQEYGIDVINDLEGNYQNTVIRQKYAMRSGETDAAIIVNNEKIKEDNTFNGKYVKLSSLPNYIPDAFISIEDKNFYQHDGINKKRIVKAVFNNIKSMSWKALWQYNAFLSSKK